MFDERGMQPLHPMLFNEYMQANATVPQVSDGIKWWVHNAFLTHQPVTVAQMAVSEFDPNQTVVLQKVTTAIHKANNIPWQAAVEGQVPEGITPLLPADFQVLMLRVRHSLVGNLYHYLHPETNYKNDLEHDLQVPSPHMVGVVQEALDKGDLGIYQNRLGIIMKSLHSDLGKALLSAYRGEFKAGKRTSAIWRTEGHGSKFAWLVQDALVREGIDPIQTDTQRFLQLNNLSQFPAFGGQR